MSRKISASEMKLKGYSDEQIRSLKDAYQKKALLKRDELLQVFSDLEARRNEALADVRENGMVLTQDKFSARGALYQVRVVNPALRIAQDCERQMTALGKLLVEEADPDGSKSGADVLAESRRFLAEAGIEPN
jgi:hypothetical protein